MKAIAHVGSLTKLANKLGCKYQSIQQWNPAKIPADWVLPIESVTNGAVTRYELRPDLYPPDDNQ